MKGGGKEYHPMLDEDALSMSSMRASEGSKKLDIVDCRPFPVCGRVDVSVHWMDVVMIVLEARGRALFRNDDLWSGGWVGLYVEEM